MWLFCDTSLVLLWLAVGLLLLAAFMLLFFGPVALAVAVLFFVAFRLAFVHLSLGFRLVLAWLFFGLSLAPDWLLFACGFAVFWQLC